LSIKEIDNKAIVSKNKQVAPNCGIQFRLASKYKLTNFSKMKGGFLVGFASKNFDVTGLEHYRNGYYVHTNGFGKYCQKGCNGEKFLNEHFEVKKSSDILIVENKGGNLSYDLNGKSFGIAFKSIPMDYLPTITFIKDQECKFEFEIMVEE
jgi:hypothetical protein